MAKKCGHCAMLKNNKDVNTYILKIHRRANLQETGSRREEPQRARKVKTEDKKRGLSTQILRQPRLARFGVWLASIMNI